MASRTPSSRARTRCSAVNGPPTRVSRASGRARRDAGEDVEQHVDALARDRAADVQQLDAAPRPEQPRRLDVGRRVGVRRAAGVGAVGNDRQPIRAGSRPASTSASRVASLSHAHVRGLAQTRRESAASSSGTAHERRSSSRLQHRAERVEVVAGHERAAGRQRVHQVRVAVIDDVEHVEAAAQRRQRRADSRRTAPARDPIERRADRAGGAASRGRISVASIARRAPRLRCAISMSATRSMLGHPLRA